MGSRETPIPWPALFGLGLTAGVALVVVDNIAFEGEASPIVIVALLLAATFTAGVLWGRRGWIAAATAYLCVPLAHLIQHLLGLPDTLQPNTYASILLLAAFTLAIAGIGFGCGVLLRRLASVVAS